MTGPQLEPSIAMKALVCDKFGSLDDIHYRDVPEPILGPEDVLIQVRAAAAVFTDLLFAQARYQMKPELPFVLGSIVSGEIVALGERVGRWKLGDRVASVASRFGGFAERVAIPATVPGHLPPMLTHELGAAAMSGMGTAQHALRQKGALRSGETLVITGAAGGTGSAAIQVAKVLGARVIAVCSSDDRAAFCRSLGADETINYSRENLKSAILSLTWGRGADVVFETVGGEVFDHCARAMAVDGRLLVVGFASGQLPSLPVNLPLVKAYSVIGVHWLTFIEHAPEKHARNMDELCGWLGRSDLVPVIDSVAPLSQGVGALRRLAARQAMGKLILQPQPVHLQ